MTNMLKYFDFTEKITSFNDMNFFKIQKHKIFKNNFDTIIQEMIKTGTIELKVACPPCYQRLEYSHKSLLKGISIIFKKESFNNQNNNIQKLAENFEFVNSSQDLNILPQFNLDTKKKHFNS